MRQRGETLVTRVVNDTLAGVPATVDVGWWRLDGTACELATYAVQLPANGMTTISSAPRLSSSEHDPREWLYAAVLRAPDGEAYDHSILTFAPHRELALAAPELTVTTLADGQIQLLQSGILPCRTRRRSWQGVVVG